MASKLKPGSIASEAARLSIELGSIVTVDQIRYWRSQGYPLDDTAALRKRLRNQQRVPKMAREIPEDHTVAAAYITDAIVKSAKGSIPISDLLDYLRDEWEAKEWRASITHDMSKDELVARAKRDVKWDILKLRDLIGIDIVEQHRAKLCDELWPEPDAD